MIVTQWTQKSSNKVFSSKKQNKTKQNKKNKGKANELVRLETVTKFHLRGVLS